MVYLAVAEENVLSDCESIGFCLVRFYFLAGDIFIFDDNDN